MTARLLGFATALMLTWAPAIAGPPTGGPADAAPSGHPSANIAMAGPNTWAKVADAPGPRSSFGLVYVPGEKAFVVLGGQMWTDPRMDPKAVDAPYSELTLNLDKGVWENRFPKGQESWGPPVGPSKAPAFPGSYYNFNMKDAEGNVRPYLGAGYNNSMCNWGNWTFDGARGRAVLYWTLAQQMAEYDPAARAWEVTTSAADLPEQFRDGMLFGSMCYDPVNQEILSCQGEWAYRTGKWRKLEFGGETVNGLRARAEVLRVRARGLAGACRARYYIAETGEEAKAKLGQAAAGLARDVTALADEIKAAGAKAAGHEKTQLAWATEALAAGLAALNKAAAGLAGQPTPEAIHAADAAREWLGRATQALAVCPPKRAHSPMVYDAANRKIVLFGGDGLDRFLADTWVYDPANRSWEQRRPKLSPSPRAGHKLVWLAKAGKVLLIDGHGYKGNGEMWVYDTRDNSWQLLAEGGPARTVTAGRDRFPTPAAAGEDDTVVACLRVDRAAVATFAAKIDAARVDAAGTAKRGVGPMAETPDPSFRDDPQWYDNNGPPPDPAAEEELLDKLPPNTWAARQSPNWPKFQYPICRGWGTCALDTDRDELLHFGGGHFTLDGNNVLHYSIRSNRYYIGHRPESALAFGGIGLPALESYQGRPFMSCHTYHSYGYDPTLGRLVFTGTRTEGKMFTYDPRAGDWALDLAAAFHKNEFNLRYWELTACVSTPKGLVAWTGQELWRVDAARMNWRKLAAQGKLPGVGPDQHGIAYDSKRDRLLLFASGLKGDVMACDIKTGQTALLDPAGKDAAAAPCRETVYLPECDAVLIGARPANPPPGSGPAGPDDKPRWLAYDCARNAWLAVAFAGDDPIGKERFNVSLGLMYDPKRKLVWAMDMLSRPYVVRVDLARADTR